MTQDQSGTQRTVRAATHVVNVTSVIHTTNVRIPLQEIVALVKLRGLVIPEDAQLQAALNIEQGVLTISWSKENQDRQTANTLPMPLIHDPDPDLTAPEPEEPASEEEKNKDFGAFIGRVQRSAEQVIHGGEPPHPDPEAKSGVCPWCGKPMRANQRGEPTCFNPECDGDGPRTVEEINKCVLEVQAAIDAQCKQRDRLMEQREALQEQRKDDHYTPEQLRQAAGVVLQGDPPDAGNGRNESLGN